MNEQNNQEQRMEPHERQEAEWIARLLQAGGGLNEEIEGLDATQRAAVDGWSSFLNECRGELQTEVSSDQLREARLRERVLAESTREDLSLRGDWSLVRGFLNQRLRSSVLLRVVAASLLLHMVALPVMAYYTFVQPQQTSTIRFDLNGAELERLYEDVLPEVVPGPMSSEWPELDSLEGNAMARGWLNDHLLAGVDWAASDPKSVIWADPLGLALLAEVQLVSDLGENSDSWTRATQRLNYLAGELRGHLREPGSAVAKPEVRRYLASAWLHLRGAGMGAEDPVLERDCTVWIGSVLPLEGEARTSAYQAAAHALDAR